MFKLLIILATVTSQASAVSSTAQISNKYTNDLIKCNNQNDEQKDDISKLKKTTYQVNDFEGITDDIVYEYVLSTAASIETDKQTETLLNYILSEGDNWFKLIKQNFKVPTEPNIPVIARLGVIANENCPKYFGSIFLSFSLEFSISPSNKDISKLQYYIDTDYQGYLNIPYDNSYTEEDVLANIDLQLGDLEKQIYGVQGILNIAYNSKSLIIDKHENFDPYNPLGKEDLKNDYVTDFDYSIQSTNGWVGNLNFSHLLIGNQMLENFTNWKNELNNHDILNKNVKASPLTIYQNSGDFNLNTYDLVKNSFINVLIASGNLVGEHIFGSSKGCALNDDFLDKYSRFMNWNYSLIDDDLDKKISQYEITLGFNWFKNIPLSNISKDDTINFTVDIDYKNVAPVEKFNASPADVPTTTLDSTLFDGTPSIDFDSKYETVGILNSNGIDIKNFRNLNYSFDIQAINGQGQDAAISGYNQGENWEKIGIQELLNAGDQGLEFKVAYDDSPMINHPWWGDKISIQYNIRLNCFSENKYEVQVKTSVHAWNRSNIPFVRSKAKIGIQFKNQEYYLSDLY